MNESPARRAFFMDAPQPEGSGTSFVRAATSPVAAMPVADGGRA